VYYFLFFVLLVSNYYHLDISLCEKIHDYEEMTLSSSKREARQVTLEHLACFNIVPKPHTLGFGFILGQLCLAMQS
jgi:hypothetical protein